MNLDSTLTPGTFLVGLTKNRITKILPGFQGIHMESSLILGQILERAVIQAL